MNYEALITLSIFALPFVLTIVLIVAIVVRRAYCVRKLRRAHEAYLATARTRYAMELTQMAKRSGINVSGYEPVVNADGSVTYVAYRSGDCLEMVPEHNVICRNDDSEDQKFKR